MANSDVRYGLRPIKHLVTGATSGFTTRRYYVPSTDATALYIGDPVDLAGSADARGVPTVTRATAGDTYHITGVVAGVEISDGVNVPNLNIAYRAASTARYIHVYDDPFLIFTIQDDGSAALGATEVGLNANIVFTHGGSATTGLSGAEIIASTVAANASFQLTILRMYDIATNALGVNAEWEVMINLHRYLATGDGDGSLGV